MTSSHGGSGDALARAGRGRGTTTAGLASSLGSGSGGGATGSAAGAGGVFGCLGGILGATEGHDVGLASLLVSGVADVLGVAEIEELQADEGRHGLSVVLEAGGTAVGATDTAVGESCLNNT